MKNTMPINPKKTGPTQQQLAYQGRSTSEPERNKLLDQVLRLDTSHSPLPQQTQKPMQTRSAGQQFAVAASQHSPLFPEDYSDQPRHALELRYLEELDQMKAHAQRLADALKKLTERAGMGFCHDATHDGLLNCEAIAKAREALAQWNKESPADADALEALDQLKQLEGGE